MAAMNPHARRDQSQPVPRIGRDELNLAEFPIALLADRVSEGQKSLYFEDRHGRLTITGSDAYGLPTAADADVIIALIYLTKIRNNFNDAKVNFSRYELIKLLDWPDDGRSYKRLEESLDRWHGVSLSYDGCWWNNRLKCYTDMKIHIIDTIELVVASVRGKTRLAGRGESPLSWFRWNKEFLESCQADNLRQLDLDEYFSLGKRRIRAPVSLPRQAVLPARRLDVRPARDRLRARGVEPQLSRRLQDQGKAATGHRRAGANRLPETAQPQRSLHPDRPRPMVDPSHPAIAHAGRAQPAAPVAVEPEPPLVAELVSRGVTRATAAELVRQHPAERIAAKVEVFDWLAEKQDKRIARSPAGYLVKSITDDHAAPKGFVPKAERQRREEERRAQERAQADQQRRDREQAARDQAPASGGGRLPGASEPGRAEGRRGRGAGPGRPRARPSYEEAPARLRGTMVLLLVREHVVQELSRGTISVEDSTPS